MGRFVAKVPFSLRPGIGKDYSRAKTDISCFEQSECNRKKEYIFQKMQRITKHAYNNILFYKEYYDLNGFHPEQLKHYEDISLIPIINKNILLRWDLEKRSFNASEGIKVNTGGTSGKPLSLFTPPSKMGIEWAHIHYIWKKQMNFEPTNLKLMMVGRSDVRNSVEYDFIRHSLKVDLYTSLDNVAEKLLSRFEDDKIFFLHGYPGVLYEFALYCQKNDSLLQKIRKDIKGCILNSEFPQKYQRKLIESTFNVKSHAFYGHTEGCVIAYENLANEYIPLHSYGYAEVNNIDGQQNLIGTNFYNYISPLIRYNTEDIVRKVKHEEDILTSFELTEGRKNDFILDVDSKKISLTGLIFGRHHYLFDYCTHIQVSQKIPGFAEIRYIPASREISDPGSLFDSKNVKIEFDFKAVLEPERTPNGKLKLLV